MTDGLFDLGPENSSVQSSAQRTATDGQVQRLRDLFASRGPENQNERKRYVERIANRPVAALKELTPGEARRVIELLEKPATNTSTDGGLAPASSWDDREHETWIDKL